MQIKLDELLRAVNGAHTALADLEDATEAELDEFKARYVKLAQDAKDGNGDEDGDEAPV
jgi:low affinity Fe/Cu permease